MRRVPQARDAWRSVAAGGYTRVVRTDVARRIDELLPRRSDRPEIDLLYRMMRDYPARGGKGIRSELLLLTAEAFGGDSDTAAWLAAGVELFQNWVLIHDDIEDDSEERRGRPALHREYGMPLALNAGDALHAYMWAAVLRANVPGAAEEFVQMIHRTAEGQHVDLAWVEHGRWDLTADDYLAMVRLKTSYYTVVTPLRLGVMAAGVTAGERPELFELFERGGLSLGAAFQIRDDVLNLVADARAYGKEIAGDLLEGKRTLIALHWLAGASEQQRSVFLGEMSRPRHEKDAAVIARILGWMLEGEAVPAAMRVAHALMDEGLTALRAALEQAPNAEAAGGILVLLEQLATRER